MVKRFYEVAGRIIMSKPGFEATTSLADANKLFDSNWNFTGSVIAAGRIAFGGSSYDITFDAQAYVPAAEVWAEGPGPYDSRSMFHLGYIGLGGNPTSRIFTNKIEVRNIESGLNMDTLCYVVYGLSQ